MLRQSSISPVSNRFWQPLSVIEISHFPPAPAVVQGIRVTALRCFSDVWDVEFVSELRCQSYVVSVVSGRIKTVRLAPQELFFCLIRFWPWTGFPATQPLLR